jgi:hypothetical protein
MDGWRKRFLFWLTEWGVLFVLWFIYTGRPGWSEVTAGAGAAILGATGAEAVRGLNFARFYPYSGLLLRVWRAPAFLLRDCWLLLEALVLESVLGRRNEGGMKSAGFNAGGQDTRSATRRALAITFVSLTPNSIVIHIDERKNKILYHQLVPGPLPDLAKRLGVEP